MLAGMHVDYEKTAKQTVLILTLKAVDRASTATEMGPMLATADCRLSSLPLVILMELDILAPRPFLE